MRLTACLLEFAIAVFVLCLFFGGAWVVDRVSPITFWQALLTGTAGWVAAIQGSDWGFALRMYLEDRREQDKEDEE